jgi:hypothetical protein
MFIRGAVAALLLSGGCRAPQPAEPDATPPAAPDASAPDTAPPVGPVIYSVSIPPQTGSTVTFHVPPTTAGALLLVSVFAEGEYAGDGYLQAGSGNLRRDEMVTTDCGRNVELFESWGALEGGVTSLTLQLGGLNTVGAHVLEISGDMGVRTSGTDGPFTSDAAVTAADQLPACAGDVVLSQIASCADVAPLGGTGFADVGAQGGFDTQYIVAPQNGMYGAAWTTAAASTGTNTRSFSSRAFESCDDSP